MIRSAKLFAILLASFIFLQACAEQTASEEETTDTTPTTVPLPTPEGLTALPEGDNTVIGVAAYGAAAAYADVCLLDTPVDEPRCTRADAQGDYALTPIEPDRGYLSATFLNETGASQTLYSMFAFSEAPSETVHINPSTDAIARIANILDCGEDLRLRVDTECVASNETLTSASTGLQNLLGPLWPDLRDPFSGPFEPNPDTDRLDRLHEMTNYQLTGNYIEVLDLEGTRMAYAPLDQLAVVATGATPENVTRTTDELAERAETVYSMQVPRTINSRFQMLITVRPASALGPTEFDSQVQVRANPAQDVNEAARAQFTLLYPTGQLAQWTEEFSQPLGLAFTNIDSGNFWLTEPGTYTLIVDLLIVDNIESETLVLTASQDIVLGLGDDTNPDNYDYGADGSCYSQAQDTSKGFYFCFESANGLIYNDDQQNNGLEALCAVTGSSLAMVDQPGRCPRVTLHGGFYTGYCSLVAGYGRMYFYEAPGRDYGSAGGAIFLAEQRCNALEGSWISAAQ